MCVCVSMWVSGCVYVFECVWMCLCVFLCVYVCCVFLCVCLLQPRSQLLVGLHNPFHKHLCSALHWMADKEKLNSLDFLNAGLTTNSIFWNCALLLKLNVSIYFNFLLFSAVPRPMLDHEKLSLECLQSFPNNMEPSH